MTLLAPSKGLFLFVAVCFCFVFFFADGVRIDEGTKARVAAQSSIQAGQRYETHVPVNTYFKTQPDSAAHMIRHSVKQKTSTRVSHSKATVAAEFHLPESDHSEINNRRALARGLVAVSKQQMKPGLNGDVCETSSDCKQPRRCLDEAGLDTNTAQECTDSAYECYCIKPKMCVTAANCDAGEQCFSFGSYPICFSKEAGEYREWPQATPLVENAEEQVFGFNGEACSADSDCEGSRQCVTLRFPSLASVSCSALSVACACVDQKNIFCTEDDDCDSGELCQKLFEELVCVSRKLSLASIVPMLYLYSEIAGNEKTLSDTLKSFASTESSTIDDGTAGDEEEERGVCIGLNALEHLHEEQLLFARPRLSRVLCDSNDSCATPGHLVSYKQKVMMMKTYCKLSGCVEKKMHVNSPRFRRAMRIESNTKLLSFTALSARYETLAEERVLSLAVRVGLL